MPVSQLPRDEISRRIKAARDLRGIEQGDLAAKMKGDGIPMSHLGQLERRKRSLMRVHQESILQHLRLPERWLTDPNLDIVIGYEPGGEVDQPPRDLDQALALLLDTIKAVQDQLPRLGRDIGRLDLEWHPTRGRLGSGRQDAA